MEKKEITKPKARHVWKLNPKTRIKTSKKVYTRAQGRKEVRKITQEIHWFGET